MTTKILQGPRQVLYLGERGYPPELEQVHRPPERLYVIGDVRALVPGLAVIGARKATPYGMSCARRFAGIAAEKGMSVVSGGARGCDSESHRAALAAGGVTVAFLGGGCDRLYPAEHAGLFQKIIDGGGAVVSEHPWDQSPRGYMFRERNRLIAGLSVAVLIVEAGLPSGTFSTADEALGLGKEVLVVPGAITSEASRGSNRLLYQGATPIVDDESFEDALFSLAGTLKRPRRAARPASPDDDPLVSAALAAPMRTEELYQLAVRAYGAEQARVKMMETLMEAESRRVLARQPDGRWGPCVDGMPRQPRANPREADRRGGRAVQTAG